MMRDIYLGVSLPFESDIAQDHSEDILMWLLATVSRLNLLYLNRHPKTLSLYDSGVVYSPPDQVTAPSIDQSQLQKLFKLLREMGLDPETGMMVYRIVRGAEVFLDIPGLYARKHGDCNEIVPVRVAELWRAGVPASPCLTKERNSRGGWTYHAIVKWPDGSAEDPSLILGMGGPSRAADRQEEIGKNKERWGTWLAAAHTLAASGANPITLGHHIDSMGIVPRDGEFANLWGNRAR